MPELSFEHPRRLIQEIEQPANDATPRPVEIASILVWHLERLTTRLDELEHGKQRKVQNRQGSPRRIRSRHRQ